MTNKIKPKLTINTFQAVYDYPRKKGLEVIGDHDLFYLWDRNMSIQVKFSGESPLTYELFSFTVKLYKGDINDEINWKLLAVSKKLDVMVDDEGDIYFEQNLELEVPQPMLFDVDEYVLVLDHCNLSVAKSNLLISRYDENPNKVLVPMGCSSNLATAAGFSSTLLVKLRVNSTKPQDVRTLIYAHLVYINDNESFYDLSGRIITSEFITCVIPPYGEGEFEFALIHDKDLSLDDKRLHVVLTISGKQYLTIPVHKLVIPLTKESLRPYFAMDVSEQVASLSNVPLLAPDNYNAHVLYLKKRRCFELEQNSEKSIAVAKHYLFTGKRGVGKLTAARHLFELWKPLLNLQQFAVIDAMSQYEITTGFSPNLESFIDDCSNKMVYIKNAEALSMKGSIGSLTGIEILANRLSRYKNLIVILSGKKNSLQQMIHMTELSRELFSQQFHFDDVMPEAQLAIAQSYLKGYGLSLSDDAHEKMANLISYRYNLRGSSYRNIYDLYELIDGLVVPSYVNHRYDEALADTRESLVIEAIDIPDIEERDPKQSMANLLSLVGLESVKESIVNHMSLVNVNKTRAQYGLFNRMPPMHMVFTGNPGTGKTTIAKYIGELYYGIGVLSSGHMVETDRSKLVGQYIGDTEKNTLNAIESASGGVLFIDEAYNLCVESQDRRDFGMRVIETLLTYLSQEDTDMIVILAGYTNEMNQLLASNPGLKSRFPYLFNFEDYSPDQLMKIGLNVLEKEQYSLTEEAHKALSKYVIEQYNAKDEHFGNGRFVTRLMTSHIIPSQSKRISQLPQVGLTVEDLTTITIADIPVHNKHIYVTTAIDDTIIANSLLQLDELVGVENAKKAIHDFITISRLKHEKGVLRLNGRGLNWNFIGSSGTGKSTVAEILGTILQGLGFLKRGHTISVNADEFVHHQSYEVLDNALKRATDGLLFLDLDAPNYKDKSFDSIHVWLENRIKELKISVALVFAESNDRNSVIAKNLAQNGIASFDHSIIFNDFNEHELCQIFKSLMKRDYNLELSQKAEQEINNYIINLDRSAKRSCDVNARTMQLLAQVVAQKAQLRMAGTLDNEELVVYDDVNQFIWDHKSNSGFGKVGYR